LCRVYTRDSGTKLSRTEKELRVFMKENNRVAKFLIENGWEYCDSCCIWETGYTLSFRKVAEDIQNKYIFFQWHWSDHGSDFFWGNMRGFFNYVKKPTPHPTMHAEIDAILIEDLENLPQYEAQLKKALKTQRMVKT